MAALYSVNGEQTSGAGVNSDDLDSAIGYVPNNNNKEDSPNTEKTTQGTTLDQSITDGQSLKDIENDSRASQVILSDTVTAEDCP